MKFRFTLFLLVLALIPISLHAAPYSSIVVFGDSVLDGGNDDTAVTSYYKLYGNPFIASDGSTVPTKNFRFSDGYTFIENLAQSLSLFHPETFFNYSVGGNKATSQNQILTDYYTDIQASTLDPSTLYVIALGMNDLGTQTDLIVNELILALESLYTNGARHFLVVNCLTDVPSLTRTTIKDKINAKNASFLLNQTLAKRVSQLSFAKNITYFDLGTAIASIQANPTIYGFVNGKDSCLSDDGRQLTICDNIGGYVFWDIVHLSKSAHESVGLLLESYLNQQTKKLGILVNVDALNNINVKGAPTTIAALTTHAQSTSIKTVSFFVDGQLISTDAEAPYVTEWMSDSTGPHTITVIAESEDGETVSSQPILVNTVAQTEPAVVYLSNAGAGNVEGTVLINLNDEVNTVDRVELWANETLLLETFTKPPYQFSWQNAPDGAYTLVAKVFPNKTPKNMLESSPLVLTVDSQQALQDLTIRLSDPVSDDGFVTGHLNANLVDPSGLVSSIHFTVGGDIVASDYSAPYSLEWAGVSQGSYVLNAIAVSQSGLSTISPPLRIIVEPVNQLAPTEEYPTPPVSDSPL